MKHEIELDDLAFEFFNILIPAAKVEKELKYISELNHSTEISEKINNNILKTELYIANKAHQSGTSISDINKKLLIDISKQVFGDICSWSHGFRVEVKKQYPLPKDIEPMLDLVIESIASLWNNALNDPELSCQVLTYAYHSVLNIKPFFDGNERIARLFANYIAVKFDLPLFEISPDKNDKSAYNTFIQELKEADVGNLNKLNKRISNIICKTQEDIKNTKLFTSATVTD